MVKQYSLSFPTRARYALQVLVDISVYGAFEKVRIKDIAARQGVSVKYLEQIVSTLSKAGYVKGERGPQGGYVLSIAPNNITAGMIVRLMEGEIFPGTQTSKTEPEYLWTAKCIELGLWNKINNNVDGILDNTTIEDLVDYARNEKLMDILDSPEYFI